MVKVVKGMMKLGSNMMKLDKVYKQRNTTQCFQSLTNRITTITNIMSPPVLMCVSKEEREKAGYTSFRQWLENPQNEYIGPNVRKYAPNHPQSHWTNPFYGYYQGEEANELYESFIRNNDILKKCLPALKDKVLGCWCTNGCHGEVLIKLYKQYVHENDESKMMFYMNK